MVKIIKINLNFSKLINKFFYNIFIFFGSPKQDKPITLYSSPYFLNPIIE